MIGVNDLIGGSTPEDVARDISKIVDSLQTKMKVTVLSVMATREKYSYINGKIAALNQKVSDSCAAPCHFIDLSNVIGRAELRQQYSLDGLHLNVDGYSAISEPIAKAVSSQN
jgi:lysophospholipase L1-like esterase